MNRAAETTALWSWRGGDDRVAVGFVGRGPADRQAALAAVGGPPPEGVAWAEQIHSARVLTAAAGACGRGDALVTDRPGLALAVATADCVPLVLGAGDRVAVVHAGWRGIAAGVVAEALAQLPSPERVTAWIGPAIGACCYEVGDDVAARVAAVSDPAVVRPGSGERPHLDLVAAVRAQLASGGVERIRVSGLCTRCTPELWSYRRGDRDARNWTFAWLKG